MSKTPGQQQGIQSVEVAMRPLEAIERLRGPAGLSTIATEAGMSPSATHRYLVSLARAGLVTQDAASGLYDLGPAARRLGIEAIRRSDDVNAATVHAARLRDVTAHTVNLSVWADHGPTIVRWEYGSYPLPIVARVGSTLPVVDSSVGRVFLAYLPSQVTRAVIRSQQRFGESSKPTAAELKDVIAAVRRDASSTTVNGVIPGLIVLAAPAFGPNRALSVVFACVIPARVVKPKTLVFVQSQLKLVAETFSAELDGAIP